ncbi:hypothetical protein BH09SUM1_BH09SUM1_33660 [soil metagenome]
MEFTIELYLSSSGASPVRQFLDEYEAADPIHYKALTEKVEKLKDGRLHREPLTKSLGDGLMELRQTGRLNTRVLWFFQKGRRIILVHGIRHKAQKIPKSDLDITRSRMKDWIKRSA